MQITLSFPSSLQEINIDLLLKQLNHLVLKSWGENWNNFIIIQIKWKEIILYNHSLNKLVIHIPLLVWPLLSTYFYSQLEHHLFLPQLQLSLLAVKYSILRGKNKIYMYGHGSFHKFLQPIISGSYTSLPFR